MKGTDDMQRQIGIVRQYLDQLPDMAFTLAVRSVLALILFVVGSRLIAFLRRLIKRALVRSGASTEAKQFLDSVLKAVLHVILILLILQVFGLEAASIATVIGSVGVTIGLAIQGSLGNCIGGILILTLRPFKVGDYIIEDTHQNEGVVEQITIFYTRLCTVDNRIVLIPNGTLANSSMTNVTGAPFRRVDLTISISYDSDVKTARQVVKQIAAAHPLVCQERDVSVYVDHFEDSGVALLIFFWAKTQDYWQARFEMLEQIREGFDAAGVRIPYPRVDVCLNPDKTDR